jgi:hypothetical protein
VRDQPSQPDRRVEQAHAAVAHPEELDGGHDDERDDETADERLGDEVACDDRRARIAA